MCENDDEGRPPIQLPNELLYLITKPLEDADRVSLALSRSFDGFASFYNAKWNNKNITVSYKYYFLTGPSPWDNYLTQHSCFPLNITSLQLNDCYWMPADILYQVITKLENLTELGVKDTQVTFSYLAKVLRTCQKITKLELSYREQNWYELKRSLTEENNMMDAIIYGFKKLTCLKIATCIHDARDYLNDPWLLIIRILSWCRDCTDLAVEVTYSGRFDDSGDREEELVLSPAVQRIKKCVQNELFAKMDWVVNLRSLVLVKYGLFANVFPACKNLVNSRLLDQLLGWIFSDSRKPVSLRRFWMQDYVTRTAVINIWSPPHPMTTYVLDGKKGVYLDHDIDAESDMGSFVHSNIAITPNERFNHLEHLALLRVAEPLSHHPRGYLPNLKYARVSCQNDNGCRQILDEFLLMHPTLEFLHVDFCYASYYVPLISDSVFKLSRLRVLLYDIYDLQSAQNRQNIVEALSNYCPNLEVLELRNTTLDEENQPMDASFLSGCRFPKLTTLTLRGSIQLNDGAFLVQMIQHCPKLKRLRMSVLFDPLTFFPNFEKFLKSAVKLRDLGLTSSMDAGGQHFLTIFKTIRKFSPDLERLFLTDTELPVGCPAFQQPGDMETTIVDFAYNMKHLVALVLGFPNDFPSSRMNDICSMMMERVSPRRPALWYWFCLDRDIPTPVDPNVPLIHHHEMILPCYYPPPL